MQQTQSIGGEVYGELTTSATIPNDPSARAGAAWFDVHPSLSGGVLSGANMRRQGYVTLSATTSSIRLYRSHRRATRRW